MSKLGREGRRKSREISFKNERPETCLIITEGTETEVNYFENMKKIINGRYRKRNSRKLSNKKDLKTSIPRNQYIVNLNKHLNINKLSDGKYNKNISDIFDRTADKVDIAIKRSEKLREYHKTQRQDKESEINPGTSVDILVKELLPYIKSP